MKRFLLSTVAALGLVSVANAADLPARGVPVAPIYVAAPMFTWTGFYVGVNGGYGFAGKHEIDGLGSLKAHGGTVGGTIGVNQQYGNIVLGLEGDFNWADFKGSKTLPYYCTCATETVSGKVDSFGTARARIGYAFGALLPYITGGVYWQHAKATDAYTHKGLPDGSYSATINTAGYTVGAGLEYAFDSHWSVKGEYLYAQVKNGTVSFDGDGYSLKTTQNIARAGVNYRF